MNKLMTLLLKLQPMMTRLLLVMTVVMSMSVFAQDAGVSALPAADTLSADLPPDVSLVQLTSDPLNVELLSRFVLHAVVEHNWGLLAAILMAALIAALRKFVPAETPVGKWLNGKLGVIVVNLALNLAAAFALLFLGKGTFSLAMVIKAISMAVTTSGSWSIYKSINEAIAEKKAQTAGTDAATTPTSTLDK